MKTSVRIDELGKHGPVTGHYASEAWNGRLRTSTFALSEGTPLGERSIQMSADHSNPAYTSRKAVIELARPDGARTTRTYQTDVHDGSPMERTSLVQAASPQAMRRLSVQTLTPNAGGLEERTTLNTRSYTVRDGKRSSTRAYLTAQPDGTERFVKFVRASEDGAPATTKVFIDYKKVR